MVPELEKPWVTEVHVRMDCNGCVQRIKRALHGIEGIYNVYFDFPQQKLTVVGRADPEKIVRAIKKTRKIATICSHTEAGDPNGSEQPTAEQTANSKQPASDATNQPPSEAPAQATPPAEPTKEALPPENPAPEEKPSSESTHAATSQPGGPSEPKDVEEIHMIHHYPHHYGYREHWNNHPTNSYGTQHEAPYYITHSYNTYRPSASISEYGYLWSPEQNVQFNGPEHYRNDYYHTRGNNDGNNIISMFSDENPNACRIV